MNEISTFIPEMLTGYEKEWKPERSFKYIAPGMAIPEEVMK